MRYTFMPPPGWSRVPFPPPHVGVYLRAPVPPGPDSASILLFDAVVAAGSLADHLDAFVKQLTEGVKTKVQKPASLRSAAYGGLWVQLTAQVTGANGKSREEGRAYVLFDAGQERLPIAFVGGPKALASHQKTFDALLQSVGPLDTAGLYRTWAE